jgi:hypothetical protein
MYCNIDQDHSWHTSMQHTYTSDELDGITLLKSSSVARDLATDGNGDLD